MDGFIIHEWGTPEARTRISKPSAQTLVSSIAMPSRLATAALALITLPVLGQSAPNAPAGTVDNPTHVGPGVAPPRVIFQPDTDFHLTEDEKKHMGSMQVKLIVDEQGFPQNVQATHCPDEHLCKAAVEFVRGYRFKPAIYQGHPVAVDLFIDVNIDPY